DFGNSTAKNLKIVSVGEGSVRVSEFQKGYGEVILIRHFDKSTNRYYETLYAHLSKRHAKVGDYVGAGQYIGDMGSTGTSSALHLHFELFFDRFTPNYKSAVNPLMYITDDSVRELQSKLKSLNIPVTVDGYHGKETVD